MKKNTKKQTIYQDLVNDIEKSKYKIGDLLPSENEIAGMYGVTRMTAREGLSILVKEGYAERIHGKGTFLINNSPQKKDVVLMLPGMNIPSDDIYFYYINNFSKIIASAESQARKCDFNLRILFSDYNEDVEKENLKSLLLNRPDALIISSICDGKNDHLLETLVDLNVFVVMVDIVNPNICNAFCTTNNYKGNLDLLNTFSNEEICYLTMNRKNSTINDRNRAYTDWCKEKNLKANIYMSDFDIRKDLQMISKEYLLNHREIFYFDNVLFSASSLFAGYCMAANELNVNISAKHFATFDQAPVLNLKYNYLEQNFSAMGTEAVKMIDNFLNGKNVENVILNGKIIIN